MITDISKTCELGQRVVVGGNDNEVGLVVQVLFLCVIMILWIRGFCLEIKRSLG